MVDDTKAISGTHGAYVPCDETALPVAASGQDTNAVYGDDEGFVTQGSVAVAEAADGTDTQAIAGQARGYVAGPCEECDDFEEFDDDADPGWGSNSITAWSVSGLFEDVGGAYARASVSGGIGRMVMNWGPSDGVSTAVRAETGSLTFAPFVSGTWTLRGRFSADVGTSYSESVLDISAANHVTGALAEVELAVFPNDPEFNQLQLKDGVPSTGTILLPAYVSDGSWYDFKWVYVQGTGQQFYLNGTLVASFTANATGLNNLDIAATVFSGSDRSVATYQFDYLRFCEET